MKESEARKQALKIVLYGNIILPNKYRLHEKADFPVNVVELPDNASTTAKEAAFGSADAVVCLHFDHPSQHIDSLRLVQLQAAGYDRIDFNCVPDHAHVCNAFGHTKAIAEYALMTMLMWTHRWKAVEDSFRAGSWEYSGSMNGPLRDELNSKVVGILGFGKMGQEIAARVHAIGSKVVACARTRPTSAVLDKGYQLDEIDAFLAECDFVVICVAYVPETESLIDAAKLAHMHDKAVLVNLARGPVVAEKDLYDALTNKSIGGAILDVWWNYPDAANPDKRGSNYPYHELNNVLMTPHSSGWTEQMMDRRWDMIVSNLRALWHGNALDNVVKAPLAG